MRTSSSNVSAAAWWPPPRHATPRPAGAGSARPSTSTPSPPSSAASAPGTCATRTATCASRRGRPGAGRLRRPAAAAGHRPGVLELAGGIHRLGPRAGRSGTRLCVRLAPDREPVERRGDGVLALHVYVSKNGTRYPWSYTLRLSAQTLPFDPSPRIHVHAASADGHAVPSSTPNAPSGYICYRLPPGPITPHPSGSPVSSGTKAGAARAAIWAGMTTWPRPCPADHPGPPARPPRPCP